MRRLGRWLAFLVAVLLGRRRGARAGSDSGSGAPERIVEPGSPERRAETIVLALLALASAGGVGFVVVYAIDSIGHQTQWLGVCLGVCLGAIAAALIVIARRLVVTEELEEDYPGEHPEEAAAVGQIVRESASRFTRKRLMVAAGGGAGAALGAALLAPALSLGPLLDTSSLADTPWRRGKRLIGSDGAPMRADDVEEGTFYTAFPEGANRSDIGSPLVVVRLDPATLRLPAERARWAPGGILAFSKICTHAGCAIALYRTPLFRPTTPRPALVCPCHYSTFDPATGGEVIFGPAGRPLPQLPLMVDGEGILRAGGNYSGPVGPSWSGVRRTRPT